MNTITNKDAKLIYSKYWYKYMGLREFPTIYIDEYWEYTIDLFNLREDWEKFLDEFNKEFESAEQYITEFERVISVMNKRYFTPDASEKVKSIDPIKYHFKNMRLYDIPDGEYWKIDIAEAFNQCLEHIGAVNPGVIYKSLINDITNYELIKKSKVLRFHLYYSLNCQHKEHLYKVCDDLLYKVIQSEEFKNKINPEDIIGICGDSLYVLKDRVMLSLGDYTIDNISIHIEQTSVKSINYKGNLLKYTDTNKSTLFYKTKIIPAPIDDYLCIMKTIKNQQLNQIDLTVGCEDQIFYVMD